MLFIARICSVVRGTSTVLLCAGAGVSVVSIGVWLPGDSLDSAMMASDKLRIVTRGAYLNLSLDVAGWQGWRGANFDVSHLVFVGLLS